METQLRLCAVVTLLFVATMNVPSALGGEPSGGVGRTVEYYTSRGVPDPQRAWEAHDFYAALEALEALPPSALPRVGVEGASGLLFERLRAARRSAPRDLVGEHQGRSILRLYEEANASTSDFWIELLEVIQLEIEISLANAMPYAEIEAGRRDAVRLHELGAEASSVRPIEERLRDYDVYYAEVSERLKRLLEAAVRVGASPDLDEAGRRRFVSAMEAVLPEIRERLSRSDRRWVGDLLGSLADRTDSAGMKEEVERLSKLVV